MPRYFFEVFVIAKRAATERDMRRFQPFITSVCGDDFKAAALGACRIALRATPSATLKVSKSTAI
ncbi:hypothetical protein CCGE531_33610 (plasmid) [Rhizobium sp. CCGE531]|nr:hypothetical protein CCGE531_33610 [Rhizobium sp. CCGE531]AYG77238.1 hypothetical protein CCGE532_32765 [Rhizobium sp. CCGE532]